LIHKVFRLKELDKEIEKSLDTYAALDRSLDKLPPGSAITIRDQDGTEIAVWKVGLEPARPAVPAEVLVVQVPGIEVAGPGVRQGLPRPGDDPSEAG
jgi:hypothetical protein